MMYAEPNILTFKNGSVYSKSTDNGYGSEIKKSNRIIDSIIVFENIKSGDEKYKIIKIAQDSLVLNSCDTSKSAMLIEKVYRKISNNLKHNKKINLVGKKFIYRYNNSIDTLYFKTDSTYSRTSINKLSAIEKKFAFDLTWERINYEGFDFIFISGTFPILIIDQKEDIINLLDYSKENLHHSLTELK